jgi:hypothetical protein
MYIISVRIYIYIVKSIPIARQRLGKRTHTEANAQQ